MRNPLRHYNRDRLAFLVEQCEARRMLTGNVGVQVKGPNLTLRGDAAANELTLYATNETVWVRGENGTTLSGVATGADNDFDTGISVAQLGKLKVKLKGGDDALHLGSGIQVQGNAVISLSKGNDSFSSHNDCVDGNANSVFQSKLAIKGAAGEDTVLLGRVGLFGKTSLKLGGDDDIVTIDTAGLEASGSKFLVNGGGGIDQLTDASGDGGSDLGVVPNGIQLNISAENIVQEFYAGYIPTQLLGIDVKQFEDANIESDVSATSISFGSATVNGSPVGALSDVGFNYEPGAGFDGVLSIMTEGASAFTGLSSGATAVVSVDYTVDVGEEIEVGTLNYTVEGGVSTLQANVVLLTDSRAEVIADVDAELGEALLEVAVAGGGDLSAFVSQLDFASMRPASGLDLACASLATAYAANGSNASAIAFDNAYASAAAIDGSMASADANQRGVANAASVDNAEATATAANNADATAFAESDSTALAISDNAGSATAFADFNSTATGSADSQSTSVASAHNASVSQALAANGSVASADAQADSLSSAAAEGDSVASATAAETSDAGALAKNGSVAGSTATSLSSATSNADNASIGSATADDNSTSVATSDDGSSATAISSVNSAANSNALNTGVSNSVATADSVATANASNTSEATAVADQGAVAEASADNVSSASADSSGGATAMALGVSLSGIQNTPLDLSEIIASASDGTSPLESTTVSGLPVGTVLSTGTSNVDGTEWTLIGPLPAVLTLTPPLGFTGTFTLGIVSQDGSSANASLKIEITIA